MERSIGNEPVATSTDDDGVEDDRSSCQTAGDEPAGAGAGTVQVSGVDEAGCDDGDPDPSAKTSVSDAASGARMNQKVLHRSAGKRYMLCQKMALCIATLLLISLIKVDSLEQAGRPQISNEHIDNIDIVLDEYEENPVIDDCAKSGRCTEEIPTTPQIISPTPPPSPVPTIISVPARARVFGRPNGRPSRLNGKPSRPSGGGLNNRPNNNNRPNKKPGGGKRPNKKPGGGKRPNKKPGGGKRPNKKPGKKKKKINMVLDEATGELTIKRRRSHDVKVVEGVYHVV